MGALRIAMAQVNPTVGDFRGNVAGIAAAIQRAREAGADLVTFPELVVCGYLPEDLLLNRSFLKAARAAVEDVARLTAAESGGARMTVVAGFPDATGGMNDSVYNAAAVMRDGRVCGVYHKIELPNYGVFDEKRYFAHGGRPLVFDMQGLRVAVTICEDVWVDGGLAERCILNAGADIVLNISASPFHAGKFGTRREVMTGFARRVGAPVFHNNLVGGQDELVFDGGSLVATPSGKVAASAKRFEEDLLVVDVSGVGPEAGEKAELVVRGPFAPKLGRIEEIYLALVLGTRDYARKNGFHKAVVGLSGGVDSSLTAAIAAEALGSDNVAGVTMPSQFTSGETRSDAERVARNLGMPLITVPIRGILDTYLDALAEPFRAGEAGSENENLQARIRGNILMALSNRFGWLVLTTGNKSEMAVGYCTLYGDMAGGFAALKDVSKTLVYELAGYVNARAGRDVIPRSVIERAPTAELRPGQKDEDSLPPYAVLDPILKAYVEDDTATEEIVCLVDAVGAGKGKATSAGPGTVTGTGGGAGTATGTGGFDPGRLFDEVVRDVVRMVDHSEYKRRQAPPGVKITPRAFGRDRRLPITNRFER